VVIYFFLTGLLLLLRPETLSGKRVKLHNVAASKIEITKRDHSTIACSRPQDRCYS